MARSKIAKQATHEFDVASAIVAERWHMATTQLQEFAGEDHPTYVNSEAMQEMYDNLRELTYRMAGDGAVRRHQHEIDSVFEELLGKIECDLRDLAIRIELDKLRSQVIAA